MKDLGQHPDFPNSRVIFDDCAEFCHATPYPSAQDLAFFYKSTYRDIRKEAPNHEYLQFMKARAVQQKQFILNHSKKTHFENVLDIGSGCGTLLNVLTDYSTKLVGYEPDQNMAGYAQKVNPTSKIRFINSLFQPELSKEKYDLITMSHVFEHVPNPIDFLNHVVTNCLRPEGKLFIEVPNDLPYWVELQIQKRIQGLAHVNYFTKRSLGRIVSESGLYVNHIGCYGMDISKFIKRRLSDSLWSRIKAKLGIKQGVTIPDYGPLENRNQQGIYLLMLASLSDHSHVPS